MMESRLTVAMDLSTCSVIAREIAEHMRGWGPPASPQLPEGYLNPQGAADYLGVSRKRVYDLTSMGALAPDGRDGRTPLFRRSSLDAYVEGT